jgi:hypothetical protein
MNNFCHCKFNKNSKLEFNQLNNKFTLGPMTHGCKQGEVDGSLLYVKEKYI